MEAIEHEREPVGPDPVAERRHRRIGGMHGEAAIPHSHRRVVREADEVERAGEIGPLDRVAVANAEHTVSVQAEARRPEQLVHRGGVAARLGEVVLLDDRGQPEDRRDRCARLSQAHSGFRSRELDCLVDDRDVRTVVGAGRPSASAVGGTRVVVGLVDGLPTASEVAERLGHELDVPRPRACTAARVEEAAFCSEPTGEGEVMQAHPRRDAGVARRREHRR
jgi:plasmid stability protein